MLFFRESPKKARGFPAKNELSGSPVDHFSVMEATAVHSASSCKFGHVETIGDLEIGKDMARNQNPVALMNIEIGGKWTFIPPKYGIIGFDPSPYGKMFWKIKVTYCGF